MDQLTSFMMTKLDARLCTYSYQGIIDCKGTETFSKESKLAKLLQVKSFNSFLP